MAITAVVVVATLLISFLAGFFFRETTYETSPEIPPIDALPAEDAPGEDVVGLPRYPGAVRVEYESHTLGDTRVREVGYLTEDRLGDAEDFYRRELDENGWSLQGSDTNGGELGLLASRNGVEMVVELEQEGELVEIEMELSEPLDA